LTDPVVIFYSIDSFACVSPHWWEFFELTSHHKGEGY